jgi:hypothetical protein
LLLQFFFFGADIFFWFFFPPPPPPPPRIDMSHPQHLCPITREQMKFPVTASDGHTYERKAIEAWMQNGRPAGVTATSPMTNLPLATVVLVDNYVMRREIAGVNYTPKRELKKPRVLQEMLWTMRW